LKVLLPKRRNPPSGSYGVQTFLSLPKLGPKIGQVCAIRAEGGGRIKSVNRKKDRKKKARGGGGLSLNSDEGQSLNKTGERIWVGDAGQKLKRPKRKSSTDRG